MANWAEGTFKVRGKHENVLRFLREGVNTTAWPGQNVPTLSVESGEFGSYELLIGGQQPNGREELYIKGTRRAVLLPDKSDLYGLDDYDNKRPALIEFPFKQAWAADAEPMIEISKQFEIDIHIFVWEQGMQFGQEIEIIHGDLKKNVEMTYDDYEWEAPFSTIGG
jgi:hypothetical protein